MGEKQKLRKLYKLQGAALDIAYQLVLRNRPMSEAVWIALNAVAISNGTACPLVKEWH